MPVVARLDILNVDKKPNLVLVKENLLLKQINEKDPFVYLDYEQLKIYNYAIRYIRGVEEDKIKFLKVFEQMFLSNRFSYIRGEKMQIRSSYLKKLEEITDIKLNSKVMKKYLDSYNSVH